MIAALFVETDGCYFGLPDVDPWDITRDARLYAGPYRVVAHPPCQRWGRFWHGSTRKPHQFKLGDDDGCFKSALESVQRFRGVLEHPADSQAWDHFGLTKPKRGGGWIPCGLGWTCYVEQGHYGHMSRKPTWLYAFGQMDITRIELDPWRTAPTSSRAGQARLREGAAHRHDRHGRRQGQNKDSQRDADSVPRCPAEDREQLMIETSANP